MARAMLLRRRPSRSRTADLTTGGEIQVTRMRAIGAKPLMSLPLRTMSPECRTLGSNLKVPPSGVLEARPERIEDHSREAKLVRAFSQCGSCPIPCLETFVTLPLSLEHEIVYI